MRRWLVLILAALCLLSGCAPAPEQPSPEPTDPVPLNRYDSQAFSVVDGFLRYDGGGLVGVDVSSYQKDIDWQAVADAGVDFAMIRVGLRGYAHGNVVEDTRFRQNIEGALAAGLKVGVYFFSQAVHMGEAVEEAHFLLRCIRDYDISFPVVFDWEPQLKESSRTLDVSREKRTDCAVAFCRTVEAAGYLPMVYFSPAMAYDLERLMEWPFWLAHYTDGWQPTPFRYHFDMWQYSCQGQVPGISAPVDLNLCLTDFAGKENP